MSNINKLHNYSTHTVHTMHVMERLVWATQNIKPLSIHDCATTIYKDFFCVMCVNYAVYSLLVTDNGCQ